MKSISTIIPSYGNLEFLLEAIRSVKKQYGYEHQIIVVDDGNAESLKPTFEAIARVPGVEVLTLEKNGGLANARNRGYERARGEFVRFLDADDIFLPGGIDAQMKVFASGADAVIGEFHLCDRYAEKLWDLEDCRPILDLEKPYRSLLFSWERGLSIPIHTVLFKREALAKLGALPFPTGFRAKEDWIFWVRLARLETKFAFTKDLVALYRQHGANMCGDHRVMGRSFLEAVHHISYEEIYETNLRNEFAQASLDHFFRYYVNAVVNTELKKFQDSVS